MDDKELLRRLKAGDREAQKTFWELHRDPVYRLIFSRSRLKKASAEEFEIRRVDDSDAQDILVSTFVSFFIDINKFRGENATMKTRLYGIAKNRIVDFIGWKTGSTYRSHPQFEPRGNAVKVQI